MIKYQFLFAAIITWLLVFSCVVNGEGGGGFFHHLQKVFSLRPKRLTDEARAALAAKHTKKVDDKAWKEEVGKIKSGDGAGEMWFLWFVRGEGEEEEAGQKLNGLYNDTIITISQSFEKRRKSQATSSLVDLSSSYPPKPNFGLVDCSVESSAPLCSRFFILSKTLPQLFVVVPNTTTTIVEIEYEYQNDTFKRPEIIESTKVGLWRYPLNENTTSARIVEFYESEGWQKLKAWDSLINPVDGMLSSIGEYVGVLYKWYKAIPQWALMLGLSLSLKHLTTKFIPAMPSSKKERKGRKEKKERRSEKLEQEQQKQQPSTLGINGKALQS